MDYAWTCRCCGQQFDTLPLSFAMAAPDPWFSVPQAKRDDGEEAWLGSDNCMIDDATFIRGCLEIPISGREEHFVWSVWVSVSRQSFERIGDLWDEPVRAGEPPFFAWLCNDISIYPSTFGLKTHLHLRDDYLRPLIELEPTDHPLAVEQRQGISIERVAELLQH